VRLAIALVAFLLTLSIQNSEAQTKLRYAHVGVANAPQTLYADEVAKLRLYAKFGVPEFWIFDSFRETVRVFRLAGDTYRTALELSASAGDLLTTAQVPGLEIDLPELFGH